VNDSKKTKAQLIEELAELRQRVEELEGGQTGVDADVSPSSSTENYMRTFDAIPLPATLIDADGIVLNVNQAFLDQARDYT
jgi:hypothetical protein